MQITPDWVDKDIWSVEFRQRHGKFEGTGQGKPLQDVVLAHISGLLGYCIIGLHGWTVLSALGSRSQDNLSEQIGIIQQIVQQGSLIRTAVGELSHVLRSPMHQDETLHEAFRINF